MRELLDGNACGVLFDKQGGGDTGLMDVQAIAVSRCGLRRCSKSPTKRIGRVANERSCVVRAQQNEFTMAEMSRIRPLVLSTSDSVRSSMALVRYTDPQIRD